jgi:hypothetical protein
MAIPMRPLSCAEARQEAARRVFEPLEAHVEATLSTHLAGCTECRAFAADVARAGDALESSLLRREPPPDLERRVIETVRRGPEPRPRSRRRLLTALAAIVLIAGGVALVASAPRAGAGATAVLSPADRAEQATGSASRTGPWLHVVVNGLPTLAAGGTYAVWAGDGSGRWVLLGEFGGSATDSRYRLPAFAPELVKVTIERADAEPESPGLDVLVGRL